MLPAQAQTLAAYNRWMNERLYAACATLSDAQRKRDTGAFFGSVHGTLNHLLLGDRVWMSRFRGTVIEISGLDQELFADFEQLRQARATQDREIEDWAGTLSTAQLAAQLHYTSVVNPAPQQRPLWLAVTHFFNHQTHHRGQLTALLSQFGVDYGVTDLVWFADQHPPPAAQGPEA